MALVSALARRPGFNKKAQSAQAVANHFALSYESNTIVYQYDVTFTIIPSRSTTDDDCPLGKKIEKNFKSWKDLIAAKGKELPQGIVFDGVKNAYSPKKLGKSNVVYDIELTPASDRRPARVLNVIIKEADQCAISFAHMYRYFKGEAPLDGDVLRAQQAIDVVLAHKPRLEHIVARRGVYDKAEREEPRTIPGGFQLRTGVCQTSYLASAGLSVNVDVIHGAFYPAIPVIKFLQMNLPETANMRSMSRDTKERALRLIKGVRLVPTHLSARRTKTKRVNVITAQTFGDVPDSESFELTRPDGSTETITVRKYFANNYNVNIGQSVWPCVKDRKGAAFPMEVLEIEPNQHMRGQFNETQLAEVIKVAARPPDRRMEAITRLSGRILNYGADEFVRSFKLSVSKDPVRISGHMLQSPVLIYGSARGGRASTTINPNNGSWNLRDVAMLNGATIVSCGCLVVGPARVNDCENFFGQFVRQATTQYGLRIGNPKAFPFKFTHANMLLESLDELHRDISKTFDRPPQLIFVFLQRRDVDMYATIKARAETELGVPTQVLLAEKCCRANPMYCANVVLKVNIKLIDPLSLNLRLQEYPAGFDSRPTMVIGIDVNHAGPGTVARSIAAMVGSCDRFVGRYGTVVRGLGIRQEILRDECGEMFKVLLNQFHRRNNSTFPQRVLVYRDGVSDGEFKAAKEIELEEMRKAAIEVGCKNVHFTYIVCKKRHHTRFMPQGPGSRTDKSGNICSGFVVDDAIVSRDHWEFYLQSQAGLQGTSRPTLYCVLVDENGFTAQGLEELTYSFTFLYARCTRAVHIVAPVYYAHLLCFRTRQYLRGLSIYDSAESNVPLPARSLKDVMYFL